MRMRLHGLSETEDGRPIDTELRRQILTLWQTALIRLSRLKIQDEIASGLRYYPAALFEVIPKVNAEVRDALRSRWPQSALLDEPIVRPGSWIGGDRDGNPNVTFETLEYALRRQCEMALRHYLTEVHYLGGELSLSARLIDVSPQMQALAERSPDTNEHRQDEPYRRALTGIYARLAATQKNLSGGDAARHAVAPQNA